MKHRGKLRLPTALSSFGRWVRVPMPDDTDVIIVCVNNGRGLRPVTLCLPGQLYVEKVEQLLRDHELGAGYHDEIVCIPARAADYITVWSVGAPRSATRDESAPAKASL